MAEFKVGDKVRHIDKKELFNSDYWELYGNGEKLTVSEVSSDGMAVILYEPKSSWCDISLIEHFHESVHREIANVVDKHLWDCIENKPKDSYHSAKHDAGKLRFDLIVEPFESIENNYTAFSQTNLPNINTTDYENVIRYAAICLGGWANLRRELARIYAFGCTRYGEESWKTVPNGLSRYKSAVSRHLDKHYQGEFINLEDGGLYHIGQVAWNAIAVIYLEKNNANKA